MKSVQQISLVVLLLAGLYACQKGAASTTGGTGGAKILGTALPLSVSDSTIDLGQPITVTLPSGFGFKGASWSTRPAQGVQIYPSGQSATFTFSIPGRYTIFALCILDTAAGIEDSCTVPVTVSDSTYQLPPDTVSLIGQNLILVPISADTSAFGITFLIETANAFPCYYSLATTEKFSGSGGYTFFVQNLQYQIQANCAGTNPAVGTLNVRVPVPPGSSTTFLLDLPGSEGEYTINIANTDTGWVFSPATLAGGLLTVSPTTLKQ